jgi:hypothetical protein
MGRATQIVLLVRETLLQAVRPNAEVVWAWGYWDRVWRLEEESRLEGRVSVSSHPFDRLTKLQNNFHCPT